MQTDYNNVLENFRNKMTVLGDFTIGLLVVRGLLGVYYRVMFVYYEVRLLIKGLLWG